VPDTGDQGFTINLALADWGYEDVVLNGPYGYAAYDIGLPLTLEDATRSASYLWS
jgi:hypothetical protein